MITAIIAEYNPLTNGHVYHIDKARKETGADTVLAVMSGSFTQRGDSAVFDKYLRAEIAVRNGADIVIELPLIYSISSADYFAYGALYTLSSVKEIGYLSFGSECGDVTALEKAAEILSAEPSEMSENIKKLLAEGNTYPKARALAFDEYVSGCESLVGLKGILDGANNVLGIAYITAAKRLNLNIKMHTVKRIGSGFNNEDTESENASSSAIRRALFEGRLSQIKDSVPIETYNQLMLYKGTPQALGDMILYKIKKISGYELAKYYDFSEGLHNRFKIAAETSSTYEEFLEKAKTKKYTMARIKRLSLYVLFDITAQFYQEALTLPPYQHILAMKRDRTDILSALSYLPNLMTRFSDLQRKCDRSIRPLVKLDWEAQGVLSIINRDNNYTKSMVLV